MSYSIFIEHAVNIGAPLPRTVGPDDAWSYTSNGARMWTSAGADLADYHGKACRDCIPSLAIAITAMEDAPEHFKSLNPPNGFGDYESLLPALRDLLKRMCQWPDAKIRVWR